MTLSRDPATGISPIGIHHLTPKRRPEAAAACGP